MPCLTSWIGSVERGVPFFPPNLKAHRCRSDRRQASRDLPDEFFGHRGRAGGDNCVPQHFTDLARAFICWEHLADTSARARLCWIGSAGI